jgi:Protein of unknown function (DUF742).
VTEGRERWLDQDAGPLVRPYTMTRGRTRAAGARFDLVAMICAVVSAPRPPSLAPEHLRILRSCQRPTSVADIASDIGLPLSVVHILLADLRDYGLITVRPPAARAQVPEAGLLLEVIQGLKAL